MFGVSIYIEIMNNNMSFVLLKTFFHIGYAADIDKWSLLRVFMYIFFPTAC